MTIWSASSIDNAHICIPGRAAAIDDMVMSITFNWSPFAGDDFLVVAAFLAARDFRCRSRAFAFFSSSLSTSVPGTSTGTTLGTLIMDSAGLVPVAVPLPPLPPPVLAVLVVLVLFVTPPPLPSV